MSEIALKLPDLIEFSSKYELDYVSPSSIDLLDTSRGGHPLKFLAYKYAKEDIVKPHLELGKLVHLYLADTNKFSTMEYDRPAEKTGLVADQAALIICAAKELNPLNEKPFEEAIVEAARELGWNSNWGDAAILKNLEICRNYVKEKVYIDSNKEGKIAVTKDQRLTLDNIKYSIDHIYQEVKHLLKDEHDPLIEIEKINTAHSAVMKGIIDRHNKKQKHNIDWKTTSSPASIFGGHSIDVFDSRYNSKLDNIFKEGQLNGYSIVRKMAFYEMLMEDVEKSSVIAIETVFPHCINIIEVSRQAIEYEKDCIKRLLDIAAACNAAKNWTLAVGNTGVKRRIYV